MNDKVKKMLAISSALALALSLSGVASAAGPDKGAQGGFGQSQLSAQGMSAAQNVQSKGGNQGAQPGMAQNTNRTQNCQNGMQDKPEGAFRGGMNELFAEAIANLSETDAAALSDYISAYESAVTAEQAALESAEEGDDLSAYREAVQTALKALLDAAEDAEIDLGIAANGMQDKPEGAFRGGMNELFAEAIANLSETDAAALSNYISAYESAVTAEQAALESAEEGDDLSAYREAVQTALKALLDAAEDAEIDLGIAPPPAK